VGSHDNYIDIYETRTYEHLRRLKGHNSYLTHLDFSKVLPLNPTYYHCVLEL
jgi:WD40 repeat protein